MPSLLKLPLNAYLICERVYELLCVHIGFGGHHHGGGFWGGRPGGGFWGPRRHWRGGWLDFLLCGMLCAPCIWCCCDNGSDPEELPIVAGSGDNPIIESNVIGTAVGTAPQYREIKALEFREGNVPVKFYLTVPDDIVYGQIIQVDLGGRPMSVKIPDYINKGEKVIIVAPAPAANLL